MPETSAKRKVNCTKCKTKHERPVGAACRRLNMNVSAPLADNQSQDESVDHEESQEQQNLSGRHSIGVEAKLDLLLRRMDSLESNNAQLQRDVQSKLSRSRFSHSSPKRPSNEVNHTTDKRPRTATISTSRSVAQDSSQHSISGISNSDDTL